MLISRQLHQLGSEDRPKPEIERHQAFFSDEDPSLLLAIRFWHSRQVDLGKRGVLRRKDYLHHLAFLHDVSGAKHLVPGYDLVQRQSQRRRIQNAPQAPSHGDVIERASRLQLIQEPQPLLPIRQGQMLWPDPSDKGRMLYPVLAPHSNVENLGECLQRPVGKNRNERNLQSGHLACARNHLRSQQ